MVVITLEKCPLSLRGDLTKWLMEISPGVYVGRVSARVRDRLWQRVCEESKGGRATMAFTARNEQHLDYRVHNTSWEPIDYDGIKLMMRPSPARLASKQSKKNSTSDAGKHRAARRHARGKGRGQPDEYAVVDIETTGLDVRHDRIIEIATVVVIGGSVEKEFSSLIACEHAVPESISELTGINARVLAEAPSAERVIDEFLDVIGDYPLVMHNAAFDSAFLDAQLERLGYEELENECVCTLELARKMLPGAPSHRLQDLCQMLGINTPSAHRALPDCQSTRELFVKLIEMHLDN